MNMASVATYSHSHANVAPRGLSAIVLDWGERAVLLGLYGWLLSRLLVQTGSDGWATNLLLAPSEGLVVLLLLIRRKANRISPRPSHWAMAFLATAGPLLVQPAAGRSLVPLGLAAALMLAGTLLEFVAKLVLGRSFGCVAADRGLKFSGPYRYVRHPMYAGYLLTHVGFLLVNLTTWNAIVYAICYANQIPRLLAEEQLLSHDPSYCQYLNTVPYRLIPGVF
jgi:protein-S-isoprenylcysteine O-methyltransferase Ste14